MYPYHDFAYLFYLLVHDFFLLSKAEQIELTEDTVAALQDAREAKELGQHNSQLTSFHDARAVVSHIQREVRPFFLSHIDALNRT